MRSTIIPAQITTVEDKIAGNLNVTQILLLLFSVFAAALVYTLLPPSHQVSPAKIGVLCLVFTISGGLALRVKGKVVLTWLSIILMYNLRPRWYVFDKNDAYLRELDLPINQKVTQKAVSLTKAKHKKTRKNHVALPVNQFQLDQLLRTNQFSTRFSFTENGALNVALEEIK
jgi:hypothetical protein